MNTISRFRKNFFEKNLNRAFCLDGSSKFFQTWGQGEKTRPWPSFIKYKDC